MKKTTYVIQNSDDGKSWSSRDLGMPSFEDRDSAIEQACELAGQRMHGEFFRVVKVEKEVAWTLHIS